MNSGVKIWFSAVELARLGGARAIDFPRNEKSTREKAKRLGWDAREVPCKGGRRGYMTEFMPPDNVLGSIHAFLKENPGFFSEVKTDTDTIKSTKHYEKSDKATALKLKSPEHGFKPCDFDPLLMHHVIVAVERMLKKHGKTIDPEKKADLFFLIHDCCKAAGGMDDSIVERFVSVAG
ncbi:MAG: hypothetical protein K2Y07_08180 [Nitrosomonas sp.]|nr:hypothetical protein [Nitrosomonas sp.]OQW83696.1 MAG: hypothetical protein BVN30_05450 [Proteobacteria bacterium ST_bin16]